MACVPPGRLMTMPNAPSRVCFATRMTACSNSGWRRSGEVISNWPASDAGPEISGTIGRAACSSVAGNAKAAASKSQRVMRMCTIFGPQLRFVPPRRHDRVRAKSTQARHVVSPVLRYSFREGPRAGLSRKSGRSSPSSAKTASERIVRIVVRDQPRLRERRAAAAPLVGAEKTKRPNRVPTRREGIVHVASIADRHFGSGIEVGARLNRDHRGGAVGMMDDRARRLDDGGGRGTINRRLVFLRRGSLGGP